MESGINLVIYIPAAAVSGFFYWQVISALRSNSGNNKERKMSLARAFFFLWVSCIVCTLPYVAFELYFINFVKVSMPPKAYPPEGLLYIYTFNQVVWKVLPKNPRTIIICEAAFRILRQSYGFLNSVLLLILLKPFQEPIRSMFVFVNKKLRGT